MGVVKWEGSWEGEIEVPITNNGCGLHEVRPSALHSNTTNQIVFLFVC